MADLLAFLLDVPPYAPAKPNYHPDDLDELLEMHLGRAVPQTEAARLREGSVTQKLSYLGRRTITKYGCYACHDIPGFEDAPPIGPALTDWLHEYLLRPYAIRPASAMRMPRYNLSEAETAKLVAFFAAHSGAGFPCAGTPPTRRLPQEPLTPELEDRLGEAMRMLLDEQTYCLRCHQLGDRFPGDAVGTTLAIDLIQFPTRMRAEYLHRLLASPTSVLPYTPMPGSFPPSGQSLDPIRFPGNSVKQLEAMTDLLLNYDWYLRQGGSIRELMEGPLE